MFRLLGQVTEATQNRNRVGHWVEPEDSHFPVSVRHNPRRCLIKVDFPAPFSPTSPKTQPRGTMRDTSHNAFLGPNLRDRFLISTTSGILLSTFLAESPFRQIVFNESSDLVLIQIQ
jgi:hypothetical protein